MATETLWDIGEPVKRCRKCHAIKPVESFVKIRKLNRRHSWCRECCKANKKEFAAKNPELQKRRNLEWDFKAMYGISTARYERLLATQEHRCAICGGQESAKDSKGKVQRLSVDHNHATGKVRGLLCRACNHLIGNAKENVKILYSAIAYLETHNKEKSCG